MIKLFLIGSILLLFNGCGTYSKQQIKLQCLENKIYFTVYSEDYIDLKTDIAKPRNIILQGVYPKIKCTKEIK